MARPTSSKQAPRTLKAGGSEAGKGSAASERWHVLFGPADQRMMTLEELDSAYRLNMITESTHVWKEGMREWVPLGVIAGIEEPPEPAPSYAPMTLAYAGPAGSVAGAVAMGPPLPPARAQTLSAELMAMTRASRSPTRWVYAVLFVAGVGAATFRNDVLKLAAERVGASSIYELVERKVTGRPGFGTPRSVRELVTQSNVAIPDLRAARQARVKLEADAAKASETSVPAAPEAPPAGPNQPEKGAPVTKSGHKAPGPTSDSTTDPFAKGKKQKLDEHDPLNPNL